MPAFLFFSFNGVYLLFTFLRVQVFPIFYILCSFNDEKNGFLSIYSKWTFFYLLVRQYSWTSVIEHGLRVCWSFFAISVRKSFNAVNRWPFCVLLFQHKSVNMILIKIIISGYYFGGLGLGGGGKPNLIVKIFNECVS